MLFLKREEQYAFSTSKLRMENVRKVYVKMHMCYGSLSANEQHGVSLNKTGGQVFRPGKIGDQLGRMIKNIEEEDAPFRRPFPHHIDIIPKRHIIVGCIDWRVGITLYIIVNAHPDIPSHFLKEIPNPFFKGVPLFGKVFYDQRFHRFVILPLKF